MSTGDERVLDNRYREIANYSVKSPWRKKEIVVLIAEKLDVSERTVRDRLDYLEENGFIDTVQINQKRVFVEINDGYRDIFDYEPDNKLKVQSSLEETKQLAATVTQETFPSRLNRESSLIFNWIHSVNSLIRKNTLPPKELKELEASVEDLHKHCREQFIVIHGEPQIGDLFDIFDDLIFLLENYDEINNTEDYPDIATLTTDLSTTSKTYMNLLGDMLLTARIVGYSERYNSRLSARIDKLQSIVEDGPDFIRDHMYYIIHSYGSTRQKIDSFISRIKNQDNLNYDRFLTDVRSLYTEEEKEKLLRKLKDTADELNKQQRSTVNKLCVHLEEYQLDTQIDIKTRYYNQTKRKIIAILSHGPKKLEDIERLSAERNDNVLRNINTLSDKNDVSSVKDRHGYYRLNKEIEKSFRKKRDHTPVADPKKVEETLRRMREWREKHVCLEGFRVYENEEEVLERFRDLPGLELHNYILDYSFVLDGEDELRLFFEILDQDIETLQNSDGYLLETPNDFLYIFRTVELLNKQWYRGLENINYHSCLCKRLDELKKAHNYAPLDARKFIRKLISMIHFEDAHKLFEQAVADSQESVDDLKQSVDHIYYSNNRMHEVVDFLSNDLKSSSEKREEVRKELLEYSINVPYKTQF